MSFPGVVYLVVNRVNGKAYVGKSESGKIRRRWQRHVWISKVNPRLMRIASAIHKHGAENFDIAVLSGASDSSELSQLESSFIARLGTKNRVIGYNATNGGDGSPGYERTEEHRRAMADKLRARWANPEWAAETKRKMKGKKVLTPEQRAKASEATKRSWQDPTYRLRHSAEHLRRNRCH